MTKKAQTPPATEPADEYVAHITAIHQQFIKAGWDKNNAEQMIIAMLQLQTAETFRKETHK